MKKIVTLFTLGFITLTSSAQKVIEKNIPYTHQYLEINLKFASDIKIKTWDKASIYMKVETTMEEKKYEAMFELKTESDDQHIRIGDNSESIFKKIWEDQEKEHGKKQTHFNNHNVYEIDYVLYIPKNAKFKINSINGNLSAEIIEGEFTADLINGDIQIAQYTGTMNLSTINGEIDLKMINAEVSAETIHGNIYADEKLNFTTEDRLVGQHIEGKVAAGTNSLRLNTINGNMYLRLP